VTKPLPQPWHPPDYDAIDVSAIEAVAKGVASADQQQRAVRAILEKFCRIYDQTYFADSESNTLYAQGMRGVGLNLVSVINNAPTILEALRKKGTKAA
jgi:hypothetical protein